MEDYEDIDEEALARLQDTANMESMLHAEKTPTELAETILEESAPAVAQQLVRIALGDPNSNTRLRAQTYLLDRVLGRSGDGPTKAAPWESLIASVTDVVKSEQT